MVCSKGGSTYSGGIIMSQINIKEYDASLALGVAEMWNRSMDGWGGGSSLTTAEQVEQKEAKSDNLHLYLATLGDEVVGYCGLSEYREDTGALYIPLLNVRTDMHGQKIGKQLLLKALERTIELGWPRLDLYTWPGNTKAVPLYKKCGFFWEEKDEATHLMNFIPTVLQTEVLQPYFINEDWYQASTRSIEVKPDGRKENGFDYYQYSWQLAQGNLQVEFERRGRGIRLIETDDYMISASIQNVELVFGRSYPIQYKLINKSGKPLHVVLKGSDDQHIIYSFTSSVEIENEQTIEGEFFLGKIDEEQNVWRTHPTVTTHLLINNQEAVFKLGVVTKFPLNIKGQVAGQECFLQTPSSFYLDLENNFQEEVECTFKLPSAEFIQFVQREYTVILQAKEKKSISIPYTLSSFGFYQKEILIQTKRVNGETINSTRRVGLAFKGLGAQLFGESEEYWHLYNGHYYVYLQKSNNSIIPGKITMQEHKTYLNHPSIGKPYSSELSKLKPYSVDFSKDNGTISMHASYQLEQCKGLDFVTHVKLYAEGLMQYSYEIINKEEKETADPVCINNPIFHQFDHSTFSYEDRVIEIQDASGAEYDYWESDKISENWLFTTGGKVPRGISWSQKTKVLFEGWRISFEYYLGNVKGNSSVKTDPTYISIGAYLEWESFRSFALQKSGEIEQPLSSSHLELIINEHNPIVTGDLCKVEVEDYKLAYFDGQVQLGSKYGQFERTVQELQADSKTRKVEFTPASKGRSIDVVQATVHSATEVLELESILLKTSAEEVSLTIEEEHGIPNYIVSNGIIEIKAAPDFFSSLYSMKYNGKEWLDNAFPQAKPKSWWNPWGGGSRSYLKGLTSNSIMKETSNSQFATLKDRLGNKWKGIELEIQLNKHDKYKGLSWKQYFLVLPGIPILCQTTLINQETGSYFNKATWQSETFLDICSMEILSKDGNPLTYKVGNGEMGMVTDSSIVYRAKDHNGLLQVITDNKAVEFSAYFNKEITEFTISKEINILHGESYFTPPVFYLFEEERISEAALKDLKKIRF
jgi:GNAT superfamily N-acetyltransferase